MYRIPDETPEKWAWPSLVRHNTRRRVQTAVYTRWQLARGERAFCREPGVRSPWLPTPATTEEDSHVRANLQKYRRRAVERGGLLVRAGLHRTILVDAVPQIPG